MICWEGIVVRPKGFEPLTYGSAGRYAEAERILEEALELQGGGDRGDHPLTSGLLHDLAVLQLRIGDLDTALALCRRALEMRLRLYGERHPSIAASLNLLASLEMETGRQQEAVGHFEESLAMQRRLLGPAHPQIAATLFNSALQLHHELASPRQAEPIYREALEMSEGLEGEEHSNLGFYLTGLGEVLSDLGRPAEAVPVLERALDLRQNLPERQLRNESMTRSALAGAFLEMGRLAEAEELLLSSYPILAESLGRGHRVTRRALRRLVALYTEMDDLRQAAEYQAILDAHGG